MTIWNTSFGAKMLTICPTVQVSGLGYISYASWVCSQFCVKFTNFHYHGTRGRSELRYAKLHAEDPRLSELSYVAECWCVFSVGASVAASVLSAHYVVPRLVSAVLQRVRVSHCLGDHCHWSAGLSPTCQIQPQTSVSPPIHWCVTSLF